MKFLILFTKHFTNEVEAEIKAPFVQIIGIVAGVLQKFGSNFIIYE